LIGLRFKYIISDMNNERNKIGSEILSLENEIEILEEIGVDVTDRKKKLEELKKKLKYLRG